MPLDQPHPTANLNQQSPLEARRAKGSALPAGLIGMVVLIVAIECGISRRGLELSRPEAWEWWLSGQAARRQAEAAPILCFGSSMVKQAVIPRVIGKQLQRPVYNLSLCAGPAPSSYLLLKRALDSGSRPSAILVEFHPAGLTESPSLYLDYWPHLLGIPELADLAISAREPSFFAQTTLAHLIPSIRDRNPIRASLQAALRGASESNRQYNEPLRRNVLANRGAKVIPKNPEFHGEIADHLQRTLLTDSWACHPVNLAYAHRFFALARSKSIPVFWLMPPFSPSLQAQREQRGLDAAYREFARRCQQRYDNITVVDARHSNYPDPVFIDAMHVDWQGAYAFSADLAEVLSRSVSQSSTDPRWITLPNYREPTPNVMIEDFAHSVAVVNEGRSRK